MMVSSSQAICSMLVTFIFEPANTVVGLSNDCYFTQRAQWQVAHAKLMVHC